MRRRTIEMGPSPEKEEGNKKSTTEKLKEIQQDYEKRMEEDKTLINPLSHVETKSLLPETLEVFEAMEDPERAQALLVIASEKIKRLKDKDKKSSNEVFIQWIDNQIEAKLRTKELIEDREKDN